MCKIPDPAMVDISPTERRCDGCTLCCQVVAVESLDKPLGVLCRHASACGCSLHPDHPMVCQDFKCLWLQGWFDPADRPDRLGVVLFVDCGVVCVNESSPGAAQTSRVQQLITKMLNTGISVVVRNIRSLQKIHPDGKTEKALVDQSDPLKVAILPETFTVSD